MTDLIACVHAGQSWRRSKPGLANTSRCTEMGYGNAQQRNRYAASTRAHR